MKTVCAGENNLEKEGDSEYDAGGKKRIERDSQSKRVEGNIMSLRLVKGFVLHLGISISSSVHVASNSEI